MNNQRVVHEHNIGTSTWLAVAAFFWARRRSERKNAEVAQEARLSRGHVTLLPADVQQRISAPRRKR